MATQVGEAVVKLTFDGKDVKASLNKVDSQMAASGKSTGSAWGNAWSVAAGSLISSGITKITGMITSNMDKAIQRVDIINNFPKIMSNMNISAEASQKSIGKLADKLQGLPTSLQSGALAVERFTSKNGDVAKSTDLFLALNNAILAGGAPIDAQSTALEQLAQAYAKGKPDMVEWRSAMTAMPAQLNQVAKAMGLGENAADKLGEKLRKGEISMDDFMKTIVKLNTDGGKGFKSFEEQARNSTGGIGTAMENVRNRIAAAIAKIIDHLDSEKIAEIINNISSNFGKIADGVIGIIDFLGQNKWILEFAGAFVGTLLAIGTALKIINAVMAVSPVTWIIAAVAGLVGLIVLLIKHFDVVSDWINTNLPWLADILNGIGEMIGAIGEAISQIVGVVSTLWNSVMWPIFQAIGNFLGPVLQTMFNNLVGTIQFVITVLTGLFSFIGNAVQTVVGVFLWGWQAISDGAQAVWDFITGIFGNLASFFGSIFSSAWEAVKAVFSTGGRIFAGIVDGIINGFRAIVNAIIGGINGAIAIPFNGINDILNTIRGVDIFGFKPFEWIGTINVPQLPYLAEGGYASGATTAVIGEAGKEVVLPLENNTDNWAGLLAKTLSEHMQEQDSLAGRPITVNMTNNINNEMDADDIGRVLMQSIRRAA